MFATAMLSQRLGEGLEPTMSALLDTILKIYRSGIAMGIQDQTGSPSPPSVEMDDVETIRWIVTITGSGDQRGTPFPVSNWYV
jgi:hypothetical protein